MVAAVGATARILGARVEKLVEPTDELLWCLRVVRPGLVGHRPWVVGEGSVVALFLDPADERVSDAGGFVSVAGGGPCADFADEQAEVPIVAGEGQAAELRGGR